MFLHISRIYVLFFSIQNIKINCWIIFLKFFLIIFFWQKIYSFPFIFIYKLYLLILFKVSTFVILFESFLMSSSFNTFVTAYWKHLSFLLLLFCFLSNQENLYMIHHDSDLFYDVYNTKNEHNKRQTHYLLSFLNYFDIYF